MASKGKSKFENSSFTVTFDGGLQTNVRAEVVNELVKYILYERQQIPLPVEQLKKEMTQAKMLNGIKPGIYNRIEKKKAITAITNMDRLFDQVRQVFHICPEVNQAAIILGATTVSPKEVYFIELPPLAPEATNLDLKPCLKSLFRQIVMHDPLREMKSVFLTNMTVMLKAPRMSTCPGFNPKPTYKLPNRGKHFHFNLVCNHGFITGNQHDLSKDTSAIDLSGFEPLENTFIDTSMGESSDSSCSPFSFSSFRRTFQQSYTGSQSTINGASLSSKSSQFNLSVSDTSTLSEGSVESDQPVCSSSKYPRTSDNLCVHDNLSPEVKSELTFGSLTPFREPAYVGSEYIWYQASITVKGYKDKSSKRGTKDSLL